MKPPLILSAALALAFAMSSAHAEIQWTQTTRTIGSEAIVTNPSEFALDSDSQTSAASGVFAATVSADTMVVGVSGSSTSEQSSDLIVNGLTGSGWFETTTDVNDPDGFADVFGRSLFNGYFDLDASTAYSLSGLLTNGGNGASARIALFGPSGAIVDVMAWPGTSVPFDASGTLAPGSYLITATVAGNAQELPPSLLTEASGEWEMDFLLGQATSAPLASLAPEFGVFPNPTRGRVTLSFAPPTATSARILIHDAAGRVVRALAPGTREATWDTRDSAGRLVPAGVYFVSVESDGRVSSAKAIVMR